MKKASHVKVLAYGLICWFLTTMPNAFADTQATLSPNGYGAITIGMSPTEASRALGIPLVTSPDEVVNDECYHVQPQSGPTELSLMIQQGVIVRISLYHGPSSIATDKGVRLGDPSSKVIQLYGPALSNEEHEYLGPIGRYLTWWDKTLQLGIRYETDTNEEVYRIHVGNDAITFVEGCS